MFLATAGLYEPTPLGLRNSGKTIGFLPAAAEWGRYAAELESASGPDWWKHYDFRDTQIAAIAREYGLTVATRNAKHFPFVSTENPFA